MKNKVERHMELCKRLNDIYEAKNHDYGDSFHETFKEEGIAMPRIRLSDKLNRFKNLTMREATMVDEESIRDTLMDLANYAIMTIMEIDLMDEEEDELIIIPNDPQRFRIVVNAKIPGTLGVWETISSPILNNIEIISILGVVRIQDTHLLLPISNVNHGSIELIYKENVGLQVRNNLSELYANADLTAIITYIKTIDSVVD